MFPCWIRLPRAAHWACRWAEDKGRGLDDAIDALLLKETSGKSFGTMSADMPADMPTGWEAAAHILELARGRIGENTRVPRLVVSAPDESRQREAVADICRKWNARIHAQTGVRKSGNIVMLVLDSEQEVTAETLKSWQEKYTRPSGAELYVVCSVGHAVTMRRAGMRYVCLDSGSDDDGMALLRYLSHIRPRKVFQENL